MMDWLDAMCVCGGEHTHKHKHTHTHTHTHTQETLEAQAGGCHAVDKSSRMHQQNFGLGLRPHTRTERPTGTLAVISTRFTPNFHRLTRGGHNDEWSSQWFRRWRAGGTHTCLTMGNFHKKAGSHNRRQFDGCTHNSEMSNRPPSKCPRRNVNPGK